MKERILNLTAALTLLAVSLLGCATGNNAGPIQVDTYRETLRVACIGDSITYGASIRNRVRDNYPAQLGRMLGDKWEVRNFGVSGATLLKNGDKPYWKEDAFQRALAFNPHVVVIKLGTNDTKPQNWQYKDEFVADYKDMIGQFAALPAQPRIWICQPVPAYPERWGISDERIRNEVRPLIEHIAKKAGVPVINMYEPLSNRPDLFPDKIHPNAGGARLIAKEVCRTLTGTPWTDEAKDGPLPKVLIIGDSISIGYFEPTRALLQDKAEVHHNPGNAAHSANGLAKLDAWLGDTKWDVIHFNHGLHDLKYMDPNGKLVPVAEGTQQIPLGDYERNLDELARRLKATGAKVIFATTTPVPDGSLGRLQGDAARYNQAAVRIMNKHDIPVNDLYAFALPRLDSIQRPRNVHFTEEGSRLLAERVTRSILDALGE